MAEESNDNVNEQPEEVAAEDVAGAQETPSADQLDREQAIVEEPVAESEQRAAEETSIAHTRPRPRPRRLPPAKTSSTSRTTRSRA